MGRLSSLGGGVLVGLLAAFLATAGEADDKETRRTELLRERARIDAELKALDGGQPQAAPEPPGAEAKPETPQPEEQRTAMPGVEVVDKPLLSPPPGQAETTVEREEFKFRRAFSINELTEESPGILSRQGNGPRDYNISIRGSGAKVGFGIRNIKMFEDWFPVTQSDGLSRTDITDPHAYEAVDIIRGPSSARYDNYALGGVVNWRLRRGQDIDGLEIGNDFGSYGYQNHYLTLGGQKGGFGYTVFGSYIQGDGFLRFSNFDSSTENILLTFAPDPTRSFAFKFINNNTTTNVPSRLSLNQYNVDPRSAGTVSLSVAGAPSRTVSAQQADQSREDQRTIVGARYSQLIAEGTTATFTGTFDLKDIYQIFGTITDNQNPNYNGMLDLIHEGTLFGWKAKHYLGGFVNYMHQDSSSLFNLGDYHGTSGALQAQTRGHILNAGGRAREELTFAPGWTLALGLGGESSSVQATLRSLTTGTSYNSVNVSRTFTNIAPEAAVIYQPAPNLTTHFRVGTGYGIPNISNLTTTSSGLPGNNTNLEAQQNLGVELGVDALRLFGALDLSLTGYYEWFKNEFVTQSPGAGLSNFTTNAPHSQHQGIEAAATLRPFVGIPWWDGLYLKSVYTFNDHIYTDFTEVINGVAFNRSGKQMPGVETQNLYSKLGYETRFGLGGWIEHNYLASYFVNNSNSLKAPSYNLVNVNLHWARNFVNSFVRGAEMFFEVRNLLDTQYIESAVTVTDNVINSQSSNEGKQAFFTGASRSMFGGLRLKF